MQKKIIAHQSQISAPENLNSPVAHPCNVDQVLEIHRLLSNKPDYFRISCHFDPKTWATLQTTAKTLLSLSPTTRQTLLTPSIDGDTKGGTIHANQLVELVVAILLHSTMLLHSLNECYQSAVKACLAKLKELLCSK